jgi:hypothetical protein
VGDGSKDMLEIEPPELESCESDEPLSSQLQWRQGRQLLRQYLQELGYTEAIIDVRSNRVRSLLGLEGGSEGGQQQENGNGAEKRASTNSQEQRRTAPPPKKVSLNVCSRGFFPNHWHNNI